MPAHKATNHGEANSKDGNKPKTPKSKSTLHTPVGWYQDPTDNRQMRWWDGYKWTQDVDTTSQP
jgi:hypothetical protein